MSNDEKKTFKLVADGEEIGEVPTKDGEPPDGPPRIASSRMLQLWQEANTLIGAGSYAFTEQGHRCAECAMIFQTGDVMFQYGSGPLALRQNDDDGRDAEGNEVAIRRRNDYRCGQCGYDRMQGKGRDPDGPVMVDRPVLRPAGIGIHIERPHCRVELEQLPEAVRDRVVEGLRIVDMIFQNVERAALAAKEQEQAAQAYRDGTEDEL